MVCEVWTQTNIQISQNESIFAGEMYSKIRVECAAAHFDLHLTYIDPLVTKICAKNDFLHFLS